MRISIITPTYNQADYIEQTIDSVLSQNYRNLEFVIIDGGSTDATVEIIKRYERHLSYWVSEPDRGQSHAINKGLKVVTGEVVNWLNSDDFLEPDALQLIEQVFTDPEVNVLCGRSRKFGAEKTFISRGTEVYPESLEKTIGWARIDQPETWFRKEAFDRVGELNEEMHYLMDREWWIRYLFTFGLDGIVELDDILVNFRLHEDSKTVSQSEAFQIDHDTIFLQLAKTCGVDAVAQLIEATSKTHERYSFPNIDISSAQKDLFDFYLVRKADEAYFDGNASRCRYFLNGINPSVIDDVTREFYHKLAFRSNRLIFPLISWIKRIYPK